MTKKATTTKKTAGQTVNKPGTNSKRADTKPGQVVDLSKLKTAHGRGRVLIADAIAKELDGMAVSGAKFLTDAIKRSVRIGNHLLDAEAQLKEKGSNMTAWLESDNRLFSRPQAYRYISIARAGEEKVAKLVASVQEKGEPMTFSLQKINRLITDEQRDKGEKVRGHKPGQKTDAGKAPNVEPGADFPTPDKASSGVSDSYLMEFMGRVCDLTDEQLLRLEARVSMEREARDADATVVADVA